MKGGSSSSSRLILVLAHLIILVSQLGFLTYLKKHNADQQRRQLESLRRGGGALQQQVDTTTSTTNQCYDDSLGRARQRRHETVEVVVGGEDLSEELQTKEMVSNKCQEECPPIMPCQSRRKKIEKLRAVDDAVTNAVHQGGTTLNVMPILPSGGWAKGSASVAGKALTIPHAVAELDRKTRKINIPPYVDRLCVDVGAHWSSPSSRAWWEHYPNTYVVAVEANPWSAYLLRYFGTKHYHDNAFGHMYDETHKTREQLGVPEGEEVCSARVVQRCIKKAWGHWMENEDKHTVLHAAGVDQVAGARGESTTGNLGFFNPGLPNRTDVGSIFQLQSNYRAKVKAKQMPKPQTVPLLTVGELFEYLPTPAAPPPASSSHGADDPAALGGEEEAAKAESTPADTSNDNKNNSRRSSKKKEDEGRGGGGSGGGLVWDTLKIDAQGADTLVLLGAAHTRKYLSNFMCVIGEFDTEAYEVKDSAYTAGKKGYDHRWLHMQRYQKFLIEEHGFIMMSKHFFINPRYKEIFYRGQEHYNCRASDVRRSHDDIVAVLKRFESGDLHNNKKKSSSEEGGDNKGKRSKKKV